MIKSARVRQTYRSIRRQAVALSPEEASRFAVLLEENQEALVAAWTDRVVGSLRG
jgi:hypothetical protein